MNKKYKDKSGAAITWNNYRWGKRRCVRATLIRTMNAMAIATAAVARLTSIKAVPATTKLDRIKKSMAIAQALIDSQRSIVYLYKKTGIIMTKALP